jgi:hypothetical protein
VSVCRSCGDSVTWARREEGGWRPPLDYLGQALTIRGGAVVEVPTYSQHVCDSARVEEWARRRQQERHDRAEVSQQAEVYARERAERREIALKRDCLKCGARPGEGCVNLTVLAKHGRRQDTRWPHAERMAADPEPAEELAESSG